MTDYIKFVQPISHYFNVTPDYVFQVYQHAQLTESTVWMQMTELWAIVTLVGAILFGLVFLFENRHSETRVSSFINGVVIGAFIVGIIMFLACVIYGSYAIQMAQPEYMTWISYCTQMQLSPA